MARVLSRLRRLAAAFAFLAAIVAVAFPAIAAFEPPPLSGHVVDTAGALTGNEILALDAKLDDVRQRTGYEIVAFVPGSLEGETIEDVAYKAFNTWRVGKKGLDNGVLLVVAPHERRVRIETGKGVGGALTDLQTDDILLEQVIPPLKENRVYDAVDQGTTAIARTLAGEAGAANTSHRRPGQAQHEPLSLLQVGIAGGALALILLLAIVSPGFRSFLWFFVMIFFRGGGGGGGGFGGGGGGSGYSGGGGSSGGGGASESY